MVGKNQIYSVIDIFAGSGGLGEGFKQAGFNIKLFPELINANVIHGKPYPRYSLSTSLTTNKIGMRISFE